MSVKNMLDRATQSKHPRVTQGPSAMVAISVLLSCRAVVAVAFECEVAALVFLGLAVGVARYLL
jgi:hypothetical protein